jgi:hypothetical protein
MQRTNSFLGNNAAFDTAVNDHTTDDGSAVKSENPDEEEDPITFIEENIRKLDEKKQSLEKQEEDLKAESKRLFEETKQLVSS